MKNVDIRTTQGVSHVILLNFLGLGIPRQVPSLQDIYNGSYVQGGWQNAANNLKKAHAE